MFSRLDDERGTAEGGQGEVEEREQREQKEEEEVSAGRSTVGQESR